MGWLFVTGTSNVPTAPLVPPSKGMKPEFMPPLLLLASGWHGDSWADCVTVWLRAPNWNCKTSPGCAMTEFGVKVRVEPPTRMGMRRVVLVALAAVGLLRVLVVTRKRQMKRS